MWNACVYSAYNRIVYSYWQHLLTVYKIFHAESGKIDLVSLGPSE